MINDRYPKMFCSEPLSKIENYDDAVSDDTCTWDCHHKLEIVGNREVSVEELKREGKYYNRPANELIFMKHNEHMSLHLSVRNIGNDYFKGHHFSDEAKQKLSNAMTGKTSGFKGKHHSEESKKKLSLAHKGMKLTDEHKRKIADSVGKAKIGNTNVRGKKWFNDGVRSIRAFECPVGFVAGRIYARREVS